MAFVQARGNRLATSVFVTQPEDVTKAARKVIETYKNVGDTYLKVLPGRYELDGFDIAISDTDFPLHLVLQSSTATLWNIHLMPGARVTGVSILGSGATSAVAGLPPETRIEVIDSETLKDCRQSHQAFRATRDARLEAEARKAFDEGNYALYERLKRRPKSDAYRRWFRSQFGHHQDDIRIGYRRGEVALIGPLPTSKETLVPYQPLSEKVVRVFTEKDVHAMEEAAFRDMFKREAFATADRVAGGSVRNLPRGGN